MPPKKIKTDIITGKWIDEVVQAVGQYIYVETGDGIVREGRLSGLRTRKLKWNGTDVLDITELEINGDPNDTIPMERIVILRLVASEDE